MSRIPAPSPRRGMRGSVIGVRTTARRRNKSAPRIMRLGLAMPSILYRKRPGRIFEEQHFMVFGRAFAGVLLSLAVAPVLAAENTTPPPGFSGMWGRNGFNF